MLCMYHQGFFEHCCLLWFDVVDIGTYGQTCDGIFQLLNENGWSLVKENQNCIERYLEVFFNERLNFFSTLCVSVEMQKMN